MAKLFTDNYFHIGNQHLMTGKPCQDYAISDVCQNMAFAIISDGCSTGGHTDVGSRIVALSTAAAIRERWSINGNLLDESTPNEISFCQKALLPETGQKLGLSSCDMLATCIYACLSPDGGFVHALGDGVIALKDRNKHIFMSRFEWANNTPYYPAYNDDSLDNFINVHGGNLDELQLSEEIWQWDDNSFIEKDRKHYSLSNGMNGIILKISKKSMAEALEFIAIFSDGITQIENLDWKDAVVRFMNFKNTKGEFVKRRMIRGIKDSQKDGKGPQDDIACAVIRIEKQELAHEG